MIYDLDRFQNFNTRTYGLWFMVRFMLYGKDDFMIVIPLLLLIFWHTHTILKYYTTSMVVGHNFHVYEYFQLVHIVDMFFQLVIASRSLSNDRIIFPGSTSYG